MWDIHYFADRLRYMFRCVLLPGAHSRYPERIPLNANTAEVCTIDWSQNVETRWNKIKKHSWKRTSDMDTRFLCHHWVWLPSTARGRKWMNCRPCPFIVRRFILPTQTPPCTDSRCKPLLHIVFRLCGAKPERTPWIEPQTGEQRSIRLSVSGWFHLDNACICGPRGGE